MLDRIENMREVLVSAADEAQEIRRLPEWAAKEMIAAGLYRFAMPAALAGEDFLAKEQKNKLKHSKQPQQLMAQLAGVFQLILRSIFFYLNLD